MGLTFRTLVLHVVRYAKQVAALQQPLARQYVLVSNLVSNENTPYVSTEMDKGQLPEGIIQTPNLRA